MITPADNSSNSLAIDAKGLEALKQSARQNSPDSLKAAAKQFEALFMNMIMKSMREAGPQEGGLFDNQQTKMYTSMLDQELSQNMASRGVGLAEVLIRQLSVNNALADTAAMSEDNTKADNLLDQMPAAQIRDTKADNLLGQMSAAQIRDIYGKHSKLAAAYEGDSGAVAATRTAVSTSGQPAHVQAFQNKLNAHAEEASKTTGIPAKFMLGQAALESGWGKHVIRTADGGTSHNLFGIKATGGWKGKTVDAVTTEYVNGIPQKRVEKFRAYDSYADSFRDYAKLLRNNPRYEKVLANATDVQGFAQGLQKAGYATDPKYAEKLIKLINRNLSA